jgi:hypothetical protein
MKTPELPQGSPETPRDFLDERVRINFSLHPEAAEHLPEVSAEELESRQEQFRILVGRFVRQGDEVQLTVKGVLWFDETEQHGCFVEGKEEIKSVDLAKIRTEVEGLKRAAPEFKDDELIGEIHTHPILPKDMDSNPWDPSDPDIDSIIQAYELGALTPDKPYIFAVGGLDADGKMQYTFNRLIRRGGAYVVQRL